MTDALKYIDEAFGSIPETPRSYKFRMQLVDEFTQRANELTHRGIRDRNVINDLIISEHPDIKAEFEAVLSDERSRRRRRSLAVINVLCSILFALITLTAFIVHLVTVNNGLSWIILIGGFVVMSVHFTSVLCAKWTAKKGFIFNSVARIQLAFSIMLVAALAFFIMLFKFNIVHSWTVFPAGAVLALVADALYAHFARRRMAIFLYLLYIPIVCALLYVILGAVGILPWALGWLLIPAGIAIDIVIIILRLVMNQGESDEMKEDSEWNAD